jgi:alkylated DNA repair protein (DNA oxidative demethylase)
MKIISPRNDFIIVEDFFSAEQAASWLKLILNLGEDQEKGFHHPLLKPNRFHKTPRYPVKKFMCLGLYWNPEDYRYYETLPGKEVSPHPIPKELMDLTDEILHRFFESQPMNPQSIMVNFYTRDSSMGLHVDKDEEEKCAPIVGLNFGSSCRFKFEDEKNNLKDVIIPGNSIYVFGRSARLMRHGLGSIYARTLAPGSEGLLKNKERLNLTIRQVLKR